MERIKARKTAQEPEEVTTTATDVTTTATQQPEEVTTPTEASKPEQVTATAPSKTNKTRRTKTASPKPLGRDIYHIFTEKQSKWALLFDKSVYHAPEGCAVLSDNVILIESKLDYREEYSGKMILEDGSESKKDSQLIARYQKTYQSTGDKYAITPKEIEEQIKAIQDEETHTALCELFGKDMTPEEVKEELKYNKEARAYVNERTARHQTIKLLLPAGDFIHLAPKNLKTALKVAKTLATTCISNVKNILQFTGEAGKIILAGYIIRQEDENSMHPLIIDLADATPAPEDTAIEEAAPVTAPQQSEEVTTTVPEEVATEEETAETPVQEPEEVTTEEDATPAPADTEEEEKRKRREADYITVLKYCVEHYGEVGADYLDTLDYTQATEQVYTTKRGNSTKVTERFYSIDGRTIYGLHRRYNKNGKRAKFVVFEDGQIIEERTYGKNNNSYKAEVKRNDGSIRYQVEDGKVTRAEYLLTKKDIKPLSVVFDDSNRPETPRDLPAPAPTKTTSKETTKEEPATTKEEQPTSKTATAPTPEATPAPEEVKNVTTSKQDDTTPYWLLIDQELRAQQEEQEQAPATPDKSEEEPEEEPAPATEATDDPEEVVFLKGAELDKVIAEYSERNNLDIEYQNKRYYFYATADGYIVKLDKNKPKSRLYIADEGPYYDSYRKGEITARAIFFEQNMNILSDYSRQRLESPVNCNVRRTITGDLSIDPFGKIEYSYDHTTGKSEEIPVKHPTTRELAIYVAARKAYEDDQRERLEKYWKRYGHKVWVNTYWANR